MLVLGLRNWVKPQIATNSVEILTANLPVLIQILLFYSIKCERSQFFFNFLIWGQTESTWYVGHKLAYFTSPGWQMMNMEHSVECEGRGNRSTRAKPARVPFCPPQIPHDLNWDRTRTVTVGSRRLTAWSKALPKYPVLESMERRWHSEQP
jgi:hypothetical protein